MISKEDLDTAIGTLNRVLTEYYPEAISYARKKVAEDPDDAEWKKLLERTLVDYQDYKMTLWDMKKLRSLMR